MDDSRSVVGDMGEHALIERMKSVLGCSQQGIDDDAAVYTTGNGKVHVITTDALIEGVHFDRSFMPMEYLGFKALSVNVSDVVAMNAVPRYATVALGVSAATPVAMVEAIYRGLKNAADVYRVTIVGGDTTKSRDLTLVVTVVGEAPEGRIVYRNGARPGDVLCVTGNLGASHAGLRVMLRERQAMMEEKDAYRPKVHMFEYVMLRHLTPVARLRTIEDWAVRGVQPSALIDISDGLAVEAHHLCRLSKCGAIIQASALPVAEETRRIADTFHDEVHDYALFGGEDYELLFTMPGDELEKLDATSFCVVGRITEGSGVMLETASGSYVSLPPSGYRHFADT